MPAQLDLTGRVFGLLTVVSRNGTVKWGRHQAAWLCRCECGQVVSVPQNRLPHRATIPTSHIVDRCEDCRAKPCEVCGAPIPVRALNKTCSPECHRECKRRYHLAYYHNSMETRPEFRERHRQRNIDRYRDLSPEERNAVNKARHLRELKKHGRQEINRRNREAYAERMADPEKAGRYRRMRQRWTDKNRDAARKIGREWRRKWRARRAMREMKQQTDKLL